MRERVRCDDGKCDFHEDKELSGNDLDDILDGLEEQDDDIIKVWAKEDDKSVDKFAVGIENNVEALAEEEDNNLRVANRGHSEANGFATVLMKEEGFFELFVLKEICFMVILIPLSV